MWIFRSWMKCMCVWAINYQAYTIITMICAPFLRKVVEFSGYMHRHTYSHLSMNVSWQWHFIVETCSDMISPAINKTLLLFVCLFIFLVGWYSERWKEKVYDRSGMIWCNPLYEDDRQGADKGRIFFGVSEDSFHYEWIDFVGALHNIFSFGFTFRQLNFALFLCEPLSIG